MIRLVLALLVLALLAVTPAAAYHRKTDVVVQITGDGGGTIAHPHWSGFRYVIFDSDADLVGNANATRQVFLYDLQEHDRTGVRAIYQVTSGADDNQRGDTDIRGRMVVYDARPGGIGPRQLFAIDRRDGTKHAVTSGAGDSINPDIDDNGGWVVFESAADLLGGGAAGTQVYRLDFRHADPACPFPCPANGNFGLSRLTNKAGVSRNAVTSRRGKTIAFESDADPLNAGATGTQVYLFDATENALRRVSFGPGSSHNAALSRQGHIAAFESDDGAGGTQITVYHAATATSQTLTSATGAHSTRPSFDANGRTMVFASTADLLANGSTGTQLFHYDLREDVLTQITHASAVAAPAFASGSFVTFLSDSDLLGNGSSGLDLYLVNLFKLGPATIP
jgi:Tol biopolymer transport system component